MSALINLCLLSAVYCVGIFALMLLSLLETVGVMYLIEKDSVSEDSETNRNQNPGKDCNKHGKANFHSCEQGEILCQKRSVLIYMWTLLKVKKYTCSLLHQVNVH